MHHPTGKLLGTAIYTVVPGTTVTMPIRCSVNGFSGSITMIGSIRGGYLAERASVALTLDLTVVTASRQIAGHMTGTIKESGTTTPIHDPVGLDIPGTMDGTWVLRFELGQAGRAVTGTATLTLSNGVDYAFSVKGRTGANNSAVLSLAGDPSDPAANAIAIRTTITPLKGGWVRLESFSGSGNGQTIMWHAHRRLRLSSPPGYSW